MSLTLLAIQFLALTFSAQAAQPVAGTAVVTGVVIDADSRAPLASARVTLMAMPQPGQRPMGLPPSRFEGVTDERGRFVFEGLDAGRYHLDVQRNGFAPPSDAPLRGTFELTPGQLLGGVEIALKKAGAIAGRIVDARGEPVSDLSVRALRRNSFSPPSGPAGPSGPRGQMMAGIPIGQNSQTNDLGEFRVAGLPEGQYVVVASSPRPPLLTSSFADGGSVQAPTFYPGTTDIDAAEEIRVVPGQTTGGLQFAILMVKSLTISGQVVDEAGAPVATAMVQLMNGRPGVLGGPNMSRTEKDGTFRLTGIVPGEYRLIAMILKTASSNQTESGAGGGGFTGGVSTFSSSSAGASLGDGIQGGVVLGSGESFSTSPGIRPLTITVADEDITGLRIVVPARK